MAERLSGRCLCGAVTYGTASRPTWTALCHCESCRRATSAPVVAWMGFPKAGVAWKGARQFYRSSSIATRSFCPRCGTPMSFESTNWPGEVHLYAASLNDPAAYAPDIHCHHAERLPWLHLADTLDKHPGTANL